MCSIHVVAAIIKRESETEKEFLATRRCHGDWKGYWEFPGGKIEPGETPEEALIREIREELDIGIAIDGFLTTVEYDYPAFHLIMDCFWCHITEGNPVLMEHDAARWLPKEQLRQVQWLPADIGVIEAIEKTKG